VREDRSEGKDADMPWTTLSVVVAVVAAIVQILSWLETSQWLRTLRMTPKLLSGIFNVCLLALLAIGVWRLTVLENRLSAAPSTTLTAVEPKQPAPPKVKPPDLRVYAEGNKEVEGQNFEVAVNKDGSFVLPEMFIRNIGGSTAQEFRVRLFFSHPIQNASWQTLKSPEKGFVVQFFMANLGGSIAPGEPWSLQPPLSGKFAGPIPAEMSARLAIFYSQQQKPTVVNFKILPRLAP